MKRILSFILIGFFILLILFLLGSCSRKTACPAFYIKKADVPHYYVNAGTGKCYKKGRYYKWLFVFNVKPKS